jgi:SAM-dependent methyltransferase
MKPVAERTKGVLRRAARLQMVECEMAGLYDTRYYRSISSGSRRSAVSVFNHLAPLLEDGEASLVDVGCGSGAWAAVFAERFATKDIRGIDGDYVDRARLEIAEVAFQAHDLTRPLKADRRFALASSLEVAEHLPEASAPILIDTLSGFSDRVLFSAAVPGQGGEYHVNEQPLEYWRALFRARGFTAVDCIRPVLRKDRSVAPWYRYNSILYVRDDAVAALPASFGRHVVPEGTPLPNYASAWWRLRCAILSLLPASVVQALARLKRRSLNL